MISQTTDYQLLNINNYLPIDKHGSLYFLVHRYLHCHHVIQIGLKIPKKWKVLTGYDSSFDYEHGETNLNKDQQLLELPKKFLFGSIYYQRDMRSF